MAAGLQGYLFSTRPEPPLIQSRNYLVLVTICLLARWLSLGGRYSSCAQKSLVQSSVLLSVYWVSLLSAVRETSLPEMYLYLHLDIYLTILHKMLSRVKSNRVEKLSALAISLYLVYQTVYHFRLGNLLALLSAAAGLAGNDSIRQSPFLLFVSHLYACLGVFALSYPLASPDTPILSRTRLRWANPTTAQPRLVPANALSDNPR